MGNCGSSRNLDCDRCYSTDPTEGAALTGRKILISFYFSALAVLLVVLWGYVTRSLPPDLFQQSDHYTLNFLRQCFRARKRAVPAEDSLCKTTQSPKQKRRSEAIVAFLKILSDQQLITGVSILIATLSSLRYLTLYELDVVASLAYFSATSHALSLDVLRGYLYKHARVKHCRVFITVVFLALFTLVYVVDHSVIRLSDGVIMDWYGGGSKQFVLSPGTLVPCLFKRESESSFLGWRDTFYLLLMIGILFIVVGKHVSAISRVYIAPRTRDASKQYSTGRITDRVLIYWIHVRHGISMSDCYHIVYDARIHYEDRNNGHLSFWYLVESYYGGYLSQVPIWIFQLAYGTSNTVQAVWRNSIPISDELKILGFGQVVAIGLLALPLLAFLQILNGMYT
jgi:hypothetical protein